MGHCRSWHCRRRSRDGDRGELGPRSRTDVERAPSVLKVQPQVVSRMACSFGWCGLVGRGEDGSAPGGVTHSVLLSLSSHVDSLGNYLNVRPGPRVQLRRARALPPRGPRTTPDVAGTHCCPQSSWRSALRLMPEIIRLGGNLTQLLQYGS
jgi:hypothetical protein